MLIYSTNHSQGLLHYVEQKCDVTDNREQRTQAHSQRHTPALIKFKSLKILSHYKKCSSPYVGHYLYLWLSSTQSCHLMTLLEHRLKGQERVNIHHRLQTETGGELEAFCTCYLAEGRCQWSTLLFVLQIIFVIFRCFILWKNRSLFFCLNSYFLLLVHNTKAIT